MRENIRNVSRGRAGRERWEFALDGRQMAAVAVGALVIVGSSFVLGMNVGKGMSPSSTAPVASSSLDAFDAAHANLPSPPEPKSWEYEKLSGNRAPEATLHDAAPAQARVPPARPLPRPGAASATVAAQDPAATPAPTVAASSAAAPATVPAPPPAPAPASPPPAAPSAIDRAIAAVGSTTAKAVPASYAPAASGPFVIQVGASPNRSEADRIAKRFASRGARVVAADVDGKRWYRVRLASTTYDSRAEADRALSRLSRETGVRGFVTAAR
jgi:cell division protein FtsN